jgi:16S rRNA G1207 methylase RsmC
MLNISRYPQTNNPSLQAFSAADDLLLDFAGEQAATRGKLYIFHDRFGYLTCHLAERKPCFVSAYKSQEKALQLNLEHNGIAKDDIRLLNPLDDFPAPVDLALVRIPKSLELFRLYLSRIQENSHKDSVVACGFMTKYFSPQMLKTAEMFFEEVSQSRARKKARLLILRKPKAAKNIRLISKLTWQGLELRQYPGVFSSGHVDFATRFLLEHFQVRREEQRILDLASGNGIIALSILKQYEEKQWPKPELHLLDDAYLAVASSKLNLPENHCRFHYDDQLQNLEADYFDLIITNPPFHFEHEVNTEVSMQLFTEAHTRLRPGGRFVLVFNRHLLTYRSLLKRIFSKVNLVADSPKFMVLECVKSDL